MIMDAAIALQPQWVQNWLDWLMVGGFILPALLVFWQQTRLVALTSVLVGMSAGFAVFTMFDQLGYVKLLGLPHILLWTPLAYYIYTQIKRPDVPTVPRWMMIIILSTLLISLAFDYTDVARYLLGERGMMG
ncbi:MAG: hypothetical protein COB84_07850 [Rhodobacteraceae bacterium]|nr:MAG: hypothetical protein COB84_07850 [Paracoccaceae bacterium]